MTAVGGSNNIPDLERERNNIMKDFYENELPEDGNELDESFVES